MSCWVSSTTYRAKYDVADANLAVPNIVLNVSGVSDNTAGHYDQARYTGPAGFDIDTTTGALPRAALADAVLSSGALNLRIGTVTAPTIQQSAINPVDRVLLYTGTWLGV